MDRTSATAASVTTDRTARNVSMQYLDQLLIVAIKRYGSYRHLENRDKEYENYIHCNVGMNSKDFMNVT